MKESLELVDGILKFLMARKKYWLPHLIITISITVAFLLYTKAPQIGDFIYRQE